MGIDKRKHHNKIDHIEMVSMLLGFVGYPADSMFSLTALYPLKKWPFSRPDGEWPKKRSVLAVPPLQLIQKF